MMVLKARQRNQIKFYFIFSLPKGLVWFSHEQTERMLWEPQHLRACEIPLCSTA